MDYKLHRSWKLAHPPVKKQNRSVLLEFTQKNTWALIRPASDGGPYAVVSHYYYKSCYDVDDGDICQKPFSKSL